MPVMNSKTVNALKREDKIKKATKFIAYLFTEVIIISLYTEISKTLCEKKIREIKLKIQEKHMT